MIFNRLVGLRRHATHQRAVITAGKVVHLPAAATLTKIGRRPGLSSPARRQNIALILGLGNVHLVMKCTAARIAHARCCLPCFQANFCDVFRFEKLEFRRCSVGSKIENRNPAQDLIHRRRNHIAIRLLHILLALAVCFARSITAHLAHLGCQRLAG